MILEFEAGVSFRNRLLAIIIFPLAVCFQRICASFFKLFFSFLLFPEKATTIPATTTTTRWWWCRSKKQKNKREKIVNRSSNSALSDCCCCCSSVFYWLPLALKWPAFLYFSFFIYLIIYFIFLALFWRDNFLIVSLIKSRVVLLIELATRAAPTQKT